MTPLFPDDNPVAARQPKSDRLILKRLLDEAARDRRLDDEIGDAHEEVVKWADLESSGRLLKMRETQMQGDFLASVFGKALGYPNFTDPSAQWNLIQHETIHGQTPDAILGFFRQNQPREPLAVVELKGPRVHPDRDRSNGRTAVDQCWDYLVNMPPECRWGIVSNIVSFRLYERDATKRRYEHFTLQSLRDRDTFRRFFVLFHRRGLIERIAKQPPRAIQLLRKTNDRQRTVGDELYENYSLQRLNLIAHLHKREGHSLEDAVEMAQRLLDRVIFIAFCEDRGLLPRDTIERAYSALPAFSAVTNPRWQNFKSLFRFVDAGSKDHEIPGYNGGLFAEHTVDGLELPDEPWTDFFRTVGRYDFADEVNLDVLGHLFEQSITEVERLKESGLFGGDAARARDYAEMSVSAKRKRLGTYYTPPELTSRVVRYTVDELITERFADVAERYGVERADALRGAAPEDEAYWRECLGVLREVKVVDPACGSGAFLFQAYDALELRYQEVYDHLGDDASSESIAEHILNDNLYGVDISPEAVEITQLALWIRSATPGRTLATLAKNIVRGNSLVDDDSVDPHALDWRSQFPEVFDREGYAGSDGGFDCVIGNPPWERIKLQEREFFSLPAPEVATATNAAERRKLVAELESENPGLYERYEEAKARASALLTHCRKSDRYPLAGRGDINTYAVFVELAERLVAARGRVGMLTPTGIATDKTTNRLFEAIAGGGRLIRLYDFENKKRFFPEVDGRFKFCLLNFAGTGEADREAEYVFFAHSVEELEDPRRVVRLSAEDVRLLNPNSGTCPVFRSRRDAEVTKAIYRRVPVLVDKNRKKTGNPWGIRFQTMFHQTNDAEFFETADRLKADGYKAKGPDWTKGKRRFVPVYEAKMVQAYDHRAASVVTKEGNWVRQGQKKATTLVEHQNPEFFVTPRFWVDDREVRERLDGAPPYLLCFKDVTSPTNQRTMIASCLPRAGVVNSAPNALTSHESRREMCLLANLNAIVYDFVARQKISNVHLNFFIVEQLPTLAPDVYDQDCRWERGVTLERWISERVLQLTCTAEDMLPLADACGFESGSFEAYDGRLNKWKPEERMDLLAQLDAAYFLLYGVEREDAAYILDQFGHIHEREPRLRGRSYAEAVLEEFDGLSAASMAARV